jgi:hypothetical protein
MSTNHQSKRKKPTHKKKRKEGRSKCKDEKTQIRRERFFISRETYNLSTQGKIFLLREKKNQNIRNSRIGFV